MSLFNLGLCCRCDWFMNRNHWGMFGGGGDLTNIRYKTVSGIVYVLRVIAVSIEPFIAAANAFLGPDSSGIRPTIRSRLA